MREHIILIGFMGAGKSTIGRALARRLKAPFLDTDKEIESQAGASISHIFETQGEAVFREAETGLLKTLSAKGEKMVISTGGGLPLREENRRLLKRLGQVVYLQVQPDTVLKRLKGDATRPLLKGPDAREKVASLLGQRLPLYREAAHITVAVDNKRVEEIAEEILGKLKDSGGAIGQATETI